MLGSCSSTRDATVGQDNHHLVSVPKPPPFFPQLSELQTDKEGRNDARKHARDLGYRIIRYDTSIVRTGNWTQYHRRFEHFGISEGFELSASLIYCRAYNAEMDKLLLERYGAEYRKYRKKLLPPPNSEPFWMGGDPKNPRH